MATIGKASLIVVPKFNGLGKSVNNALNGVDTTPSGMTMGTKLAKGIEKGTGGLVKSGALIGAFSAATTKAMDLISSSVSGAASRFDTLNNYPRVMQALGYSAESSEGSIAKMSDRLTGLPTALNEMTSTVQGIAAITGNLDQATDAGLALNDMLLASGSNQQMTNAAMEQFRQILAKGKPEMQDWRSLTSAAPGQMAQLAKSMLGPTANANDLYFALGGGKHDPIFTMDQLMGKMIELDQTGGEGFASFEEQARNATGGVQSSMANMETAVQRGMAGVLDSIGTDTISGTLKGIGGAFESAFGIVSDVITVVKPPLSDFVGLVKDIGPSMVPAIAGVAGLAAAGKGLNGLASVASNGLGILGGIKGVATGASDSLLTLATRFKDGSKASEGLFKASGVLGGAMGGPLVFGITAAVAAAGILVGMYQDAEKKSAQFEKATTGLSDAVKNASALNEYSETVDGIGSSASVTAMSVDELTESIAGHVDKLNESTKQAQDQIANLNTAQQVISDYSGVTDLSTEAQGKLEWAIKQVNDQFGLTLTATDVANGAYQDANGNVVNLKDSINDLVEAKKNEIRLTTLSNNLTEAYAAQTEAAATLNQEQENFDSAREDIINRQMVGLHLSREQAEVEADKLIAINGTRDALDKARAEYDSTSDSISRYQDELGDSTVAASEAADAYDKWGNNVGPLVTNLLDRHGRELFQLKDDLRSLGASTDDLSKLSEDDLLSIAKSYDGTASSIVQALSDLGVGMDETKKASALAADDIKKSIKGMGDHVNKSLEGVDLDAFSQKLSDAGVDTETLKKVGSANIARLAEDTNGDIDTMVWAIEHYNDTPIFDKDGNIQVDQASLIDGQNRLYTWNGSELVDQNGNAIVDDVSLQDAQGNVYLWNGSSLKHMGTSVTVSPNDLPSTLDLITRWNNGGTELIPKVGTATIDLYQRAHDVVWGNASGGIRPNAEGGYRFHADGAIVNQATPLDIVGEAGSEAIVPLSNEKYSIPFARTLANQMDEVSTDDDLASQIAALRAENARFFAEIGRIIRENVPVIEKTSRQARIDAREASRR